MQACGCNAIKKYIYSPLRPPIPTGPFALCGGFNTLRFLWGSKLFVHRLSVLSQFIQSQCLGAPHPQRHLKASQPKIKIICVTLKWENTISPPVIITHTCTGTAEVLLFRGNAPKLHPSYSYNAKTYRGFGLVSLSVASSLLRRGPLWRRRMHPRYDFHHCGVHSDHLLDLLRAQGWSQDAWRNRAAAMTLQLLLLVGVSLLLQTDVIHRLDTGKQCSRRSTQTEGNQLYSAEYYHTVSMWKDLWSIWLNPHCQICIFNVFCRKYWVVY